MREMSFARAILLLGLVSGGWVLFLYWVFG
jgi:hypothetical protein